MGAVAAIMIRRALRGAGIALALSLAACSRNHDDKPAGDNIAMVTRTATPASRSFAGPTPLPTVTPLPTPTSFSDMRPHRAFTDPPLPPELRDDHGLIPLPPPPKGTSPTP